MKITLLNKIGVAAAAVVLFAFAATNAQAGPGPKNYVPLTTKTAVDALKPGDTFAIACPNCGAITVMTVAEDRSNLASYKCPACKAVFRVKEVGTSGKTHYAGEYVLVDKEGHAAHISVPQTQGQN